MRGGPRNRGPLTRSGTSEAARRRFGGALILPTAGYSAAAPDIPLPNPTEREREVWEQAWRSPQAHAWAAERWRWPTVAMWVRWSVRMEDPDAPAAMGNVTLRLADQIGMSPAGLVENGWRIADPEDATPATSTSTRASTSGPRNRFAPTIDAEARVSSLERARRRAEGEPDPREFLYRDDPVPGGTA